MHHIDRLKEWSEKCLHISRRFLQSTIPLSGKRDTKLDLKLSDTIAEGDDPVVIAIDSSGIKVTNRGEWMRDVWKIHRGWIKVHIAVNVKTKEVVGIEVTYE